MVKKSKKNKPKIKKILFYLLLTMLLLVAVMPKYQQLIDGIKAVKDARTDKIMLAFFAVVGTYFTAASVYVIFAFKRISFLKTLLVQLSASFANRLMPAGIGGLGIYVDYLIKNKHQPAQASSVTVMNEIVFISSHLLLLLIVLSINHKSIFDLVKDKEMASWPFIILAVLASGLVAFLLIKSKYRRSVIRFSKKTFTNIAAYRHQPGKILAALVSATATTGLFVFALYCCALAVGIEVNLVQVFIVYTAGVIIGQLFLTPGGIGGVETGIVAGLSAYGQEPTMAFSAVIIYRLITFWLPILPGYITFEILRRKRVL